MSRILMSPPDVGELEEQYVIEAIRSGWVAPAGPHLRAFEQALVERTGAAHAVAVSSGTAALHLALLGIGVGSGDVVLVPTVTFVATANAVTYTGAEPCFLDVDPATGNLDPRVFADAVANLRKEGRRVGAVIPVDLFGRCADYESLLPEAHRLGVPVIEDAAEALGATWQGTPAGSFGECAALSFNGNKVMTTSGGGALVTDNQGLADRARHLSTQAREPVVHYEHKDIGFNYRMSNILAALGIAQLRRLDQMIERRRDIRRRYRSLFSDADGVGLVSGDNDAEDNCWLTVVRVDEVTAGWSASDLSSYLETSDIETRPIWKPMHLQPVFRGYRSFLTGAAERLFAEGLTLPSGSAHSETTMEQVYDEIGRFLASRSALAVNGRGVHG